MSDSAKVIAGVVALVVALGLASDRQQPATTSTSSAAAVVTTSLDLRPAFTVDGVPALDRRKHAADLRRVIEIVEEGLTWDGGRPADERAFTRAEQVDQFVVLSRQFLLREWSFARMYPTLGAAVAAHLKQRLPNGATGPLTDQARSDWLRALGEIRAACNLVESS